jgi:hypothetical protein
MSESLEVILMSKFPVAVSKADKLELVIKLLISEGLTTSPVTKLLKLPVMVIGSPVLTVMLAEFSEALVISVVAPDPDIVIVLLRASADETEVELCPETVTDMLILFHFQ